MRCRGGTSPTLLAGERLLPPPAGSDRPRRAVSWRQHPMGLRPRCFQTRRLPLAARSQPPGRGRRARRRPKGVLPGPGASKAARPQGGQPGWAPAQGGGQTSQPVSRSPPGSPARTQPHLTAPAPGHPGLPQPPRCPLSAAAVSPTEHFSNGPWTCSPHSYQGRRSEPAGSARSAPLPGAGLAAGPPPAGPRRAAGLKARPALADITPAPPRAERGECAAAPMMPCGARGRSNPSWPFSVGREMAAPGVAVAPVLARAASSASPLLIAEALPALDRGDEMRTRQSSPPVSYPSVSVVFPGAVSRESCCRFACELLKHVLYQRHQLPLPYEQLAHFCWRAAQGGEVMKKPPSMDLASKKCQQVLVELEEMFQHLEIMFSLTVVPRVLILLGGNVMSPKELYELNFEGICEGSAEESLKTGSCVRKLFHSLFVADVFSELKALPVMGTVVMLQGHRDCGVDWFRPKLNYKVPTRGRKLTVNLSCDGDVNVNASAPQHVTSAWEDYVWFQAPVALKGFHE
ncbi:MAD2L1-binding protein [Falco biarmicus]|uniref:MAD2L1-binding protein n=1 Tax=Falco biarmicus TaxID=345155 RepID=UPI0024BC3ED0|nr:MAD2L1-binding protein [Falco biarmicus]